MSPSPTLAFLHHSGRWFDMNLGKVVLEHMSECACAAARGLIDMCRASCAQQGAGLDESIDQ